MASFNIKTKDTCSKSFFYDNTIFYYLILYLHKYYTNTVKLK